MSLSIIELELKETVNELKNSETLFKNNTEKLSLEQALIK